jgi:hypothetical protein
MLEISAGSPSTSTSGTLAMSDPTASLIAMPGALANAACTAISNSGADVPNATSVRLTISAGMPSLSDSATVPAHPPPRAAAQGQRPPARNP